MAEITGCFADEIDKGVVTIACIAPIIKNVLTALLSLVGLGLFVMMLVAGFNYLFAGGDQKKLEKAKGTLTGAMVGLMIIVVSYLIIRFISVFTGVTEVETFNLNFGD